MPMGRGPVILLACIGVVGVHTAHAESKGDFYVQDTPVSNSANSWSTVTAYCNQHTGGSVNDIVVGGGCWGSDTMIVFGSYPTLGTSTDSGGYTCKLYDTVAHTLYARVVCKSASASGDSKSNYYTATNSITKSQADASGTYAVDASCTGSDPVVDGGTYIQYGRSVMGLNAPMFENLVSQYPQGEGTSGQDYWHSSAYFLSTGSGSDTLEAIAICKSGASKSNFPIYDSSTSWSSSTNPEKWSTPCSSSTQIVLSGGCWGTGINYTNASYPQPNGTGNTDFFQCNVAPNSSGQLGVRVLCQAN